MKELGCTKKFATQVQANMVDLHFSTTISMIDSVALEERTKMGALVVKEPIGVVGCITPWNYPLNQIAAKICPAMLVGCTVVLKPSEVTPVNAYLLAEAIHESGLPKGVFNMVNGTGPGVGGKSAAVMLDDADLPKLMPQFMGQLMNNTGQSCNALSRMLVPKGKYEEAVEIAKKVAEGTKPGRSGDPNANIGPVVSQTQWDRVQGYLKKGVEEGARVVTGGPGKPAGLEDGYYVKPTVFADVNNKMTIAQEEIFGPVLSLIPYTSEQEAIDIANDTIYGLNNAVGSADDERAIDIANDTIYG